MCFLPWASLGSQHFGTRGGDATLERHRKHGDSLGATPRISGGPVGLQELKSRAYDGHHSKMNLILILNMPQETMVYLEKF